MLPGAGQQLCLSRAPSDPLQTRSWTGRVQAPCRHVAVWDNREEMSDARDPSEERGLRLFERVFSSQMKAEGMQLAKALT